MSDAQQQFLNNRGNQPWDAADCWRSAVSLSKCMYVVLGPGYGS
jgi:hypothetical protein